MLNIKVELTPAVIADKLLWGLWRSIEDSYKERYFIDIWDHFENAIRSAAYTSDLKKFLSNIKQRIPINIKAKYQTDILEIVNSGQDNQILNWLRQETTYLVMTCRVINKERKEEIKMEIEQ